MHGRILAAESTGVLGNSRLTSYDYDTLTPSQTPLGQHTVVVGDGFAAMNDQISQPIRLEKLAAALNPWRPDIEFRQPDDVATNRR